MELDEEVKEGKYTDSYRIDGPYNIAKILEDFRKK